MTAAVPSIIDSPSLEPEIVPVTADDGARAELLLFSTRPSPQHVLYWLPAMGIPAKHYLPLATALAVRGVAVALHEWRGIGSSDRRAGRQVDWGYRELLRADLPAGVQAIRARWPKAACSIGGHSLGGQLACLYAALDPQAFSGIALVASGAPYWRHFRYRYAIGAAYLLAPMLAAAHGHLPGRRIGFGGNEARGVIADWSRSGRTGRYAASGIDMDVERRLVAQRRPVLALRLRDDWLGPAASLGWLLGKMPHAVQQTDVIAPDDLQGRPADHFAWMKQPGAIASRIARWIDARDTAFTPPRS